MSHIEITTVYIDAETISLIKKEKKEPEAGTLARFMVAFYMQSTEIHHGFIFYFCGQEIRVSKKRPTKTETQIEKGIT